MSDDSVSRGDELRALAAEWRKTVPPVVPHPPIPAGTDPTSRLAAEFAACWAASDAARDVARQVRADAVVASLQAAADEMDAADRVEGSDGHE